MLRCKPRPAPLSFHAVLLAAIAWVYVGYALVYSPFLIAAGFAAHGIWDLVHHPRAITTTVPGWYPRFCAIYDFVQAGLFVVLAFATMG